MGLTGRTRAVAPFAGMVFVEIGEVIMNTLYKKALNKGVSVYVYAVYYNALGVLILLPYFLYESYRRKDKRPPLTWALICRFFVLGLLGKCLAMFAYVGTDYSNPALSAALGNLTPIFTFVLAIAFRLEKIDFRMPSTLAKSVGTVVGVLGAFIITLYKGPAIAFDHSSTPSFHSLLNQLSPESKWVLGGLFLSIGFFFAAAWSVVQTETVKMYPEKLTVVFYFVLFGTIQVAIFAVCVERDMTGWILHDKMEVISIAYSAIFGTAIRYNVITWCLNEKGPLYVAMFKPLGMVIGEIFSILFLADILHLGSVIGAVVIAFGFYTVLWGQSKENEKDVSDDDSGSDTSYAQTAPLLQSYDRSQEA